MFWITHFVGLGSLFSRCLQGKSKYFSLHWFLEPSLAKILYLKCSKNLQWDLSRRRKTCPRRTKTALLLIMKTGQASSPPAPGIGHHTYHPAGRGRWANIYLVLHMTVSDMGSEIVIKWWDLLHPAIPRPEVRRLLVLLAVVELVLVNHLIVHMDSDWLLNHYWRWLILP